jgi:hypothetical protein
MSNINIEINKTIEALNQIKNSPYKNKIELKKKYTSDLFMLLKKSNNCIEKILKLKDELIRINNYNSDGIVIYYLFDIYISKSYNLLNKNENLNQLKSFIDSISLENSSKFKSRMKIILKNILTTYIDKYNIEIPDKSIIKFYLYKIWSTFSYFNVKIINEIEIIEFIINFLGDVFNFFDLNEKENKDINQYVTKILEQTYSEDIQKSYRELIIKKMLFSIMVYYKTPTNDNITLILNNILFLINIDDYRKCENINYNEQYEKKIVYLLKYMAKIIKLNNYLTIINNNDIKNNIYKILKILVKCEVKNYNYSIFKRSNNYKIIVKNEYNRLKIELKNNNI